MGITGHVCLKFLMLSSMAVPKYHLSQGQYARCIWSAHTTVHLVNSVVQLGLGQNHGLGHTCCIVISAVQYIFALWLTNYIIDFIQHFPIPSKVFNICKL